MSYDYATERQKLFTEEGSLLYTKVRDNARALIKEAGAFMLGNAWKDLGCYDTWTAMACVDRMVELGELVECSPPGAWSQHRIFTDVRGRGR